MLRSLKRKGGFITPEGLVNFLVCHADSGIQITFWYQHVRLRKGRKGNNSFMDNDRE
jgi:hypothetical protein